MPVREEKIKTQNDHFKPLSMKQNIIFTFCVLAIFTINNVNGQSGSVGIGTNTPNSNASLELGASNKGLLLNRVALSDAGTPAPLTAHVAGMIVYNTATAGTAPNHVSPGIYYNNGTRWIRQEPSTTLGLFVTSAGTQSLVPGAFPVLTDWTITRNDFGSAFNAGVYTVPAGMEGWYSIHTAFRSNEGCSYNTAAYIQVNEATVALGNAYLGVSGGTINGQVPNIGSAVASINYYLNAGDRVRITVNATTHNCSTGALINSTALPGYTYFSMLRQ
jgi:hypothetical protein